MSLTAEAQTVVEQGRSRPSKGVERRAAPRLEVSTRRIELGAWDRAIAGFDGLVEEQLCCYAASRWPSAALEARLFFHGEELVGGALVMIQTLPLRLGSIAVCKWGPMFARADRPDPAVVYDAMIDALVAEYAGRRRMMLSMMPRAMPAVGNWQYERLKARGFRRGTTLRYPNRYLVDLRLADAGQKASLGQKWRYHLNKSLAAGLSFERASPERAGEFDALYQSMTGRKRFPDYSAYDTLPELFAAPEGLRPELFFVRHAGETVAGAVIFRGGDTAAYLFGATNERALPLRAGYFLHWEVIRWLRDNTAARWYDLGGTDGFLGLHQFKKGMVGSAGVVSQVPPVANFAAQCLPLLLGTAAFAGRELVHDVARWRGGLRGMAQPDQPQSGAGGE